MMDSARLKKARTDSGFKNPTEAARSLGWNIPTYISHENGTRPLTRNAAARYAEGFNVSPGWLLGYASAMQPNDTRRTRDEFDVMREIERLFISLSKGSRGDIVTRLKRRLAK